MPSAQAVNLSDPEPQTYQEVQNLVRTLGFLSDQCCLNEGATTSSSQRVSIVCACRVVSCSVPIWKTTSQALRAPGPASYSSFMHFDETLAPTLTLSTRQCSVLEVNVLIMSSLPLLS